MKVQYTFSADLEDVQEILYQKYSRTYNRNDLAELHQKLKVSCLEKKSFKEIEKLLTIYRDAVSTVLIDLNENLMFIGGLNRALDGHQEKEQTMEEPQKAEDLLSEAQKTSKSIKELTGMLTALTKNGNKHE